jgi:hypothetical protein
MHEALGDEQLVGHVLDNMPVGMSMGMLRPLQAHLPWVAWRPQV